jgi:integrase
VPLTTRPSHSRPRSPANGVDVLDFKQAQEEARKRRDARVREPAGKGSLFTVADAVAFYIDGLKAEGRKIADTEGRARGMILPELGDRAIADLTTEEILAWRTRLVETPARVRTAKGAPQLYRAMSDDPDGLRRRRLTANRHFAVLRVALNTAWRAGKVPSDSAWRRVRPFKWVVSARVRYLTIAEGIRLINSCDPEFRNLVMAALQTGARYGELTRLSVDDFDPDSETLAILQSKSGKPRYVHLSSEGADFFRAVCAGRPGPEIMFRQANGEPWGTSHQAEPMREACHRAGIVPAVSFHILRHTYASLSVMAGAPLHVVARNLGHADTRMCEQHYSHLAPSYVADEIRRAAPRFGFEPGNVRALSPSSSMVAMGDQSHRSPTSTLAVSGRSSTDQESKKARKQESKKERSRL